MRNPLITTANECYRDIPVASLRFEKDFVLDARVKTTRGVGWSRRHGFCSKAKICFNVAFAKIKNPFNDHFFDDC